MKCFTFDLNEYGGRMYGNTEPGMTRNYYAYNSGILTHIAVTGSAVIDPALLQDGLHTHDRRSKNQVVVWECSIETPVAVDGKPIATDEKLRFVPTKGDAGALVEVNAPFETTVADGWAGSLVEGLAVYDWSLTGRPLKPECRNRLLRLEPGESTVVTVRMPTGRIFGISIGSEKLVDFRLTYDGKKLHVQQESVRPNKVEFSAAHLLADLYVMLMIMGICGMVGVFIMLTDREFSLPVLLYSLMAGAALALVIKAGKAISLFINRPFANKSDT